MSTTITSSALTATPRAVLPCYSESNTNIVCEKYYPVPEGQIQPGFEKHFHDFYPGRLCSQLMEDLLVQAEVNVVVEDSEVITILGQLTYWADEDGAFFIAWLSHGSRSIVTAAPQNRLKRIVSRVAPVFSRIHSVRLKAVALLLALL
ncbi:hypothetical protein EYF80_015519 [Liparis tanakae]|uniref:Uncharacterized protein n=1 Tax=Liparis tanakae TaxID=230148 RepID=A0A4Z2I8C4_9TELE|nr:hypothetical protein EYF80_015519 [Liparis tanakae]